MTDTRGGEGNFTYLIKKINDTGEMRVGRDATTTRLPVTGENNRSALYERFRKKIFFLSCFIQPH
jgi:hypothetical protein